jgi:Acetyltransferases, including N-acetylases of ribosomal proteins
MERVLIRQIAQEDIEDFHRCLDSVARERKYLGFTQASPLEETRPSLLEDMERDVIRLVASDGSKIVGWCQIKSGKWEGYTHMGWLQMGVRREYRGQGIGTALLSQALEQARKGGLERVELGVYASNLAAIRLYEKYEFQIEGRKKRARKLDGRYDDIIEMALLFDA